MSDPNEVLKVVRKIAQENRTRDILRIWWTNKYRLPPTDPRFLEYTYPELLVEFYEDYFTKKEMTKEEEEVVEEDKFEIEKVEISNGEDKVFYYKTNDLVIDDIEKKFAEEMLKRKKEKKIKDKERKEEEVIEQVDFSQKEANKVLSADLIEKILRRS